MQLPWLSRPDAMVTEPTACLANTLIIRMTSSYYNVVIHNVRLPR